MPPPVFDNVRALIFGGGPSARYRAGRTLRALKPQFPNIIDATVLSAAAVMQFLRAEKNQLWLIRAGCWPAHLEHFHPLQCATEKPVIGFGALELCRPANTPQANNLLARCLGSEILPLSQQSREWAELQKQTGGDLSMADALCKLPPVSSALIDSRLLTELADYMRDGASIERAAQILGALRRVRAVRLAQLDVIDDPSMRVAQVVTSLQRGGAERIALDLARELPRHAVRPLFFALGSPARTPFERPESIVDVPFGINRAAAVRNFSLRAIELGCDVIHAHLLSAADMRSIAAFGLPMLATVHNVRQGWPADLEQTQGVQLLAACAQAVERELLNAKISIPVRTVWNGINNDEYAAGFEQQLDAARARVQFGFAHDDFVLLSLANPRPQKRLEKLPEALAELQRIFHERRIQRRVRLLIAGEASQINPDAVDSERALRAEIERLNLSDAVQFLGAINDVGPLLRAVNVLVSVSAWEGLSLAHLEALASGTPVVATAAGGSPEIARDNPGMSNVPLDAAPGKIAAAIAALIDAPRVTPPDRQSNFTLEKMAARYRSFYPRVIEAARGKRVGAGIWLIGNNFSTGGAQSSARRLLLGFKGRGIPVRAAVLQEREINLTPGLRALRAAGVNVFIPEPRAGGPLDVVRQILEQIDADPPRSILFWNVISEHKVLIADALWDIPIFDVSPGEMCFDSLDSYFAQPRPALPYRSGIEYGRRLAGVIVKYQREVERAETMLGCKAHVIPNGMPLEEWPEARTFNRADGKLVIGTSARISPQKKLEELIEALRLAQDRLPPHVLRIAGAVETGAEEYFERTKVLSADLNVEWVGEFQQSRAFLEGLDIFAMISEPAGCPNASLEAMAAGLPVIATDHGGASEQVLDGVTGLLVARGDARALADALVALANDPQRRAVFGRAGREHVKARFSLERMIADYQRVCL